MPVLDSSVVPIHSVQHHTAQHHTVQHHTAISYCPSFLTPQKILTSLFYLYHTKEERLTKLLSESDSDGSIMTLFEYFKDIHFAQDSSSLHKVKCLPLFKDVSGKFCTLEGKTSYIWPSHICNAGCNKWLTKTNAVFLSKPGAWTKLGSAEVLDIKMISALRIYSEFIFPNFGLLTAEEKIKQLKHIRDQLFDDADRDQTSKNHHRRSSAIQFIDLLKKLPCLPLPGGELRQVRDFCDPNVLLFTTFHEEFYFPPYNLCTSDWLDFLKKIGLRQKVTQEEFRVFCGKVSNGGHEDLIKASETLLEYLMKAEEWYSDDTFLAEVSNIPFVCAECLPQLNWIKPVHQAEKRFQQGRNIVYLTCLNGAALYRDCRTLLWTVKSIVKLPNFADELQVATEAEFLEHIGVITTPNPCDVVNNVKNISNSRFSNLALFQMYTDDCKQKEKECGENCLLLSILKDNFYFLHQKLGYYSETILYPLREVPCIPVCVDGNMSNIKQAVLVYPLQVITEGKECKEVHPFINPLPDVLFPFFSGVLSKIGVESTIQPIHVRKTLETIHTYMKQPLDPNTIQMVQYLLKQLYFLLKDSTEIEKHADSLFPLFLPNAERKLVQSKHLICNDKQQYRKIPLDFSSLCYSLFDLLSSSPWRELGFTPQKLCNCLPLAASPILLSSCCEEELHSSCTEVIRSSYISERLQYTFNLHMYIAKAAHLIINYTMQAADEKDCLKFTTALQVFLQNTKIKVYKHLQADIFLTLVTPRKKIGRAKVPFLFQKYAEQTFCLCLSEFAPLNILSLLASSIVSCVAQLCEVDPKALGNPDNIIERLLTAERPDHILDILEDMDIPPESLEMDDMEIPVSSKTPKLGDRVPFEMHHLLERSSIFRPEELVGYEKHTDYIIFARVVYCIQKDVEGEKNAQYLIYTQENDESGKIASVMDLFKFAQTESMPVTDHHKVDIPDDSDGFHKEGGSDEEGVIGVSSSWWQEMAPKQDITTSKVWLQQAEVDMKVLNTNLMKVEASPDHAGHVCFLAHEVAETALKAGKYATCGLHSGSLLHHQLVGHARALEELEPQLTGGLLTSAYALSNYYIETRFPNLYSPPSVPADHFSPKQARDAHRNAEIILQMMRNVIKEKSAEL